MATNASQMKMVVNELTTKGYVSRNWALQNFISRLSAIIYNLRYDYGWDFRGERVYYDKEDKSHWDYQYIVTKKGENPYEKGQDSSE